MADSLIEFSTRGIRFEHELLSLEHGSVRIFLPHRGRMLLVDRVSTLSCSRRTINALKLVAQNEATFEGQTENFHFPQALLIEALAQTCGFMMNVLEFLTQNELVPADLADSKLEGRRLRPPPLSALAESRIRQHALARAGEQLALSADVLRTHGDMWLFKVRAETSVPVAEGEITLAYPAYMRASHVGSKG